MIFLYSNPYFHALSDAGLLFEMNLIKIIKSQIYRLIQIFKTQQINIFHL